LDAFLFELNKTPHRESVSLTVYSTTSRKRVDLTTDLTAISSAFATEAPNGLTAIGLGLLTGLDSIRNDPLARPFAQKSIVLMTDGNHNTGISPDVVAVRNPQVTVHTITFGSGANRGLMQRVARPSGGVALHAENNAQLVAAFRDIARQLAVILIE
jgi:Mg-chelatase subunit ChlD